MALAALVVQGRETVLMQGSDEVRVVVW